MGSPDPFSILPYLRARAALCWAGKAGRSSSTLIRARASRLLEMTLRVAQAQVYAGLGNTEHIDEM